jgi:AraC family transcriptional regulator
LKAAYADDYLARFRRVLDFIEAHLDEELSVDRLGRVAAFSKFHFHRQFTELFGLGVHRYVQLRRLKRASYRLAYREEPSVLEVAMESGYEGPEAFARAFKKWLGQTPSEFRRRPDWESWRTTYQPLDEMRTTHMKPAHALADVKLVDFPETRVAALEHRGDPNRLGDSIRAFIEWRRKNGAPPRSSATFNLAWNDPEGVAPEEFRIDLCAATAREIAVDPCGIVAKTIPAGRCAVLRHVGSDEGLRETIRFLYVQWLPESGEELRDFPLFFQRVRFFPDVPEHEAVTDVFLPLVER